MSKKILSRIREIEQRQEEWFHGRNMAFHGGDVVLSKTTGAIGVVQYGLKEVENYQIKWYQGPKPWDFVEGSARGISLEKTDRPNPLIYKWSERVPGPSSTMIDKLNERFTEANRVRMANRTAQDVERDVAIFEEELSKKKVLEIDESKVDSIADERLEEEVYIPVNDLNKKIDKILEEE